MRIQNLDVVHIVIAEGFLNLIQELKAFLQLLVQLNVVNSLLHFGDLNVKLLLLVLDEFIEGITALGQRDLEVNLCQLQLLLIVIHTGCKVLVEADHVRADLTHFVDGVVHIVDCVGVQCFRLELAPCRCWRHLVFHDQVESLPFI